MADEPSDLTKAFLQANLEIDAEEAEEADEPKREWTDDQKRAARGMQESYESFMEMKYDEMKWELAMSLGLDDDEVDQLLDDEV